MMIEHIQTDADDTTIVIEGLTQNLKLLHLTDSHMVEGDERDPEAEEHVERYREVFAEYADGRPTNEIFQGIVGAVSDLKLDAALLTGDIIHFPSYAALEQIEYGVRDLGVPHLYTVGNHDWFFPHLPWNDETRRQYYPRFHGLTQGDPSFQVLEIGGVRLIAMDNSTYQVSSEQVRRLKQELASGKPSLLSVHVPLFIESLAGPVIDRWKAPIMMGAEDGWSDETREKWKVFENYDSTMDCLDFMTNGPCDNLAGVFCGHVHFPHMDLLRTGCYQYVGAPGFEGRYRIIELKGS